MLLYILLILAVPSFSQETNTSLPITNTSLFNAFSVVFNLKDQISDGSTPVLRQAALELEKMGIEPGFGNLCTLSSDEVALVLMKAALAEYMLGLRDPNDWSIVVANAESGQLVRQRSFSSTRFAVIESLLLISVVALGRVLWVK